MDFISYVFWDSEQITYHKHLTFDIKIDQFYLKIFECILGELCEGVNNAGSLY